VLGLNDKLGPESAGAAKPAKRKYKKRKKAAPIETPVIKEETASRAVVEDVDIVQQFIEENRDSTLNIPKENMEYVAKYAQTIAVETVNDISSITEREMEKRAVAMGAAADPQPMGLKVFSFEKALIILPKKTGVEEVLKAADTILAWLEK